MNINKNQLLVELARKGWNLIDLADNTGIAYVTLTKAMSRKTLSLKNLGKIARALDIDVEELVIFED